MPVALNGETGFVQPILPYLRIIAMMMARDAVKEITIGAR